MSSFSRQLFDGSNSRSSANAEALEDQLASMRLGDRFSSAPYSPQLRSPQPSSGSRAFFSGSGLTAPDLFSPSSTKILKVTDQIAGLSSDLTYEARMRKQEEERFKKSVQDTIDGLKQELVAEIERRKSLEQNIEARVAKAITDHLERLDGRSELRAAVESLTVRVGAIERALENEGVKLSGLDLFSGRASFSGSTRFSASAGPDDLRGGASMIGAYPQQQQTATGLGIRQEARIKHLFEEEIQKVTNMFDAASRRLDTAEASLKRTDDSVKAQAVTLDKLSSTLKDLQAQLQVESATRQEQTAVIAQRFQSDLDNVRALEGALRATTDRVAEDLSAMRADLRATIEKVTTDTVKTLTENQAAAQEELKLMYHRISQETQSREKSEEEIVNSLGASILSLQRVLSLR